MQLDCSGVCVCVLVDHCSMVHSAHAHHRDAVAAQSKRRESDRPARGDQRGGGRGVLAGVVWMNDEPGHGHGPELPN